MIVDVLRDKSPLPSLLKRVSLSKSSYYYQRAVSCQEDKYSGIRRKITELFHENAERYGYRRIHDLLKRERITLSEKVVWRLMQEETKVQLLSGRNLPFRTQCAGRGLPCRQAKREMAHGHYRVCPAGGKSLPFTNRGLFCGMVPCWTIGSSLDAALVNRMLDQAISGLKKGERPLIHSDRGCHYRWPGWISRMEQAGLERSMSKKGCSPDNLPVWGCLAE